MPVEPEAVPPYEPGTVYRVAVCGAAVCLFAAVLGQILDGTGNGGPSVGSLARLILVAIGSLSVGAALAMRANLPGVWLLGALAAFFAWFGLPEHWDSARMVVKVLGLLGLAGGVLAALPQTIRYSLILPVVAFHYFGIFMATTWPEPTPWFTQQVGTRVYLPYIQFMYLKNAYHFYSPEPGPAHHLFCLITYENVDPKTSRPEAEWITMPSRKRDWKDPLGLTYFRRLSITEQSSGVMSGMVAQSVEIREVEARRTNVAQGFHANLPKIPLAPLDTDPNQYRMPRYDIGRYLLPSYAAHLLNAHSTPERKAKSIKLYRVEHPLPDVYRFAMEKFDPHHPTTFKPYFVGEFELAADGRAELKDKQDPLLYWLTPIVPKDPATDPKKRDYEDFMSIHAKYEFNWEARVP